MAPFAKYVFWWALALAGFGVEGCQAQTSSEAPAAVPEGYHLVWSDDFNRDGPPDTSKWNYDTWGNKSAWWHDEKEYYAANRVENARVEQGNLIIEVRKDDVSALPDWHGQPYSSARLITRGKAQWTYGFFDIRAKLPCGVGQWPAIWLVGESWPKGGEIDIMEEVGFHPTEVDGTLHTVYTESHHVQQTGAMQVADLCTAFHNYQADWRHDSITFLVDGKPYYTLNRKDAGGDDPDHWPFDRPEYLILNVAMGGAWGGQHGIDEAALPARMQVEYVRVYQK